MLSPASSDHSGQMTTRIEASHMSLRDASSLHEDEDGNDGRDDDVDEETN